MAPHFDPYIHGTTSSIFTLLERTNYQILGPLKMAKDYHLVPVTGEFFKGGYKKKGGINLINEDNKICFAKLSQRPNPNISTYTLERIIGDYAQLPLRSIEDLIQLFKTEVNNSHQCIAANINLLIILYGQIKQRASVDELEKLQEDIIKVQAIFAATEQFYYFLQLLGTSLFPNLEEKEKANHFFSSEKILDNQIKTILSTQNILQKLMDTKLDVGNIVANPSEENLRLIQSLFDCSFKIDDNSTIKFELFTTKKTDLKKSNLPPEYTTEYIKEQFEKMAFSYGDRFDNWLPDFLRINWLVSFFSITSVYAKHFVEMIHERVQVFNNLVNSSACALTEEQKEELSALFPLILIYESNEKLLEIGREFRCNKPLTIGKDITLIATDSRVHQLWVMEYLQRHNLDNVGVILFKELYQARKTKIKPIGITLENVRLQAEQEKLSYLIENKLGCFSDYIQRRFVYRDIQRDSLIEELQQYIKHESNDELIIAKLRELSDRAQQHHEQISGFRFFGHPKLLLNKTCGFKKTVNEIITEFQGKHAGNFS